MDNLPEVLTRLTTRLDTLESRVFALEHPADAVVALPAPASIVLESGARDSHESVSFSDAGATFAVFGKAMIGMAGAYVLRAIAESGSFPKLAVVALAIAYAGMWLVWAVRVPATAWIASTIYACTSALILAPMLWELTLRFNFLSPLATAGVMAAFVVATFVVAWKRDLTSVVWVGALTAAISAIALLLATHELVPFLAVLLLMAVLSEYAASRGRWLSVRPLVAAAADLGIVTLIYIYASAEGARPEYSNLGTSWLLAPACCLLLIYGVSIAFGTIVQLRRITVFETGQAMVAFLLAADAVLHFGAGTGTTMLGAFCLLLSAAGYAAVFGRFDQVAHDRNQFVYVSWSAALFLMGCFLCLNAPWLASCLGIAAIAAISFGVHSSRLTVAQHGLVYLAAAAFASGLLDYGFHTLEGAFPSPPADIVWVIAASVVLCYAIEAHMPNTQRKQRFFKTLSAVFAVAALAIILISALVRLTATVTTPGTSSIAVIRTLTGCVLALALAYFGPRWQRAELAWAAYATLVLIAAKLVLEDLREEHPEFIAASIFLYAVTLIMVPRLARRSLDTRPANLPSAGV